MTAIGVGPVVGPTPVPKPPTAPASPSFTAKAISETQIKLSWKSVAGAKGYLVDEWIDGSWQQVGKLGSKNTKDLIVDLNPGTTYYFDVAAFNSKGTSWAKNFKSATTVGADSSLSAYAVSNSEVDLYWNPVSGASGYMIEAWDNGSAQYAYVDGSTYYAFAGLNSNTTYYFKLTAYSAYGTTLATYWQYATTYSGSPAAPSLSAYAVSSSEVDLYWSSVSGADGYLVEEWINGSWQQIASVSSYSTSYAVTGLSANSTYYFHLVAYNAYGSTWAPSWQSATTFAAPPAAFSFTAWTMSNSQVNLYWSGVAGVDGYLIEEWMYVNGTWQWQQIGSVGGGSTSCAISGLNNNTTYYFDIVAYNAYGSTWATNWQSVTTW